MIRRLTNLFFLIVAFGVLTLPILGAPLPDEETPSNGVRVIESGKDQIIVEVATYAYESTVVQMDGKSYDLLTADGYAMTAQGGEPQLPVISFTVGVPVDSSPEILVSDIQPVKVIDEHLDLIPAPEPAPLQAANQSGDRFVHPNEVIYASDALYPVEYVKIVEDGFLRDQRIVRVEVVPFQYLPALRKVVLHQQIHIILTFNSNMDISLELKENRLNDPYEMVLRPSILNYDQAKNWRSLPEVTNTRETTVDGPRLKIDIDRDGLYRLTYVDLLNAGMNIDEVDPRLLHATNQGRDVAIYIVGEDDGVFNAEDYILFYGEKFNGDYLSTLHLDESENWMTYTQQLPDGSLGIWRPEFTSVELEKYTDDNVYWLFIDPSGNPPRMAELDGTPGTAQVPSSYTAVQHAEKDWRRWEYHFVTEDTWFWEFVLDNSVHIYTTTLSSIAQEPFSATVRGELVAFSYSDTLSPDHHTVININDGVTPVDDSYWEGRSLYTFAGQVASSDLIEGENQLKFQIMSDAYAYPQIMVNYFDVEYQRLFAAYDGAIRFSGENEGTWRYRVDNFSSSLITAYEITDALQPTIVVNPNVEPSPNGYLLEFELTHNAGDLFYAVEESAIQTPKGLLYYIPPDLKSTDNQADYLIISHPDFLAAAQSLANYRASQGLHVMSVSINDVYNEFNEGIYHPIAIKNFLEYTFSNWQSPAPLYVILVGDGTWNDKMVNTSYYGTSPVFMPVNLGWVDPWQGEVDTAHLLVTLVGDDLLPDMLVGRIPVNTPQELTAVIDKIIAFEQSPYDDWQLRNVFVADNTPDSAGDFVAYSEDIIADFIEPGYTADRIYLDDYMDYGLCGTPPYPGGPSCPNVNKAITETLSTTGAQFVAFTGHGATKNWASEQAMLIHFDDPANPNDRYYSDIDTMQNGDRLPVILSMTCLDGYWFHPILSPSLAETFLRTEMRGAVATFSPTGLGVSTGHDTLERGFLGAIYQDGIWELGLAALRAKHALIDAGFAPDLVKTFTIFGDPALRLHSSYNLVVNPASDSQAALAGSTIFYTMQVTNTGYLTDTYEIANSGNIWPVNLSSSLVTLLPGGTMSITATVEIPADVPGGSTDFVNVDFISQGDRNKTDQVVLQTVANVYGVTIEPAYSSQISLPGSTVTYTLELSNTSNDLDIFDVVVGNNIWPTTLDQSVVGPVLPGTALPITITVDLPPGAEDHANDTAIISVTSQSDPSRFAIATLNTTARTYGVNVNPSIQYGAGRVGELVEYLITATNSGGYSDQLRASITSENGWEVSPAQIDLGNLMPDESRTFTITVLIPTDVPGGFVDTEHVILSSLSDPDVTGEATIYSAANVYDLSLTTSFDTQMGEPGETVVYQLLLKNLGSVSDIFNLTASGNTWEVDLYPAEVQLLAGEAADILVQVEIPVDAIDGESDVFSIIAVSNNDPGKTASLTLTTTSFVVYSHMYIPFITK